MGESENADIHASAVDHVRGVYEHRLGGTTGANEPSRIRVAEQAEREYRLAALQAERQAIPALTHQRKVSDDIARKLLRELNFGGGAVSVRNA